MTTITFEIPKDATADEIMEAYLMQYVLPAAKAGIHPKSPEAQDVWRRVQEAVSALL